MSADVQLAALAQREHEAIRRCTRASARLNNGARFGDIAWRCKTKSIQRFLDS